MRRGWNVKSHPNWKPWSKVLEDMRTDNKPPVIEEYVENGVTVHRYASRPAQGVDHRKPTVKPTGRTW